MKGVGVQSPQHIRIFLLCVECVPKFTKQTYLLRQHKYISYLEDQGRYRQKKVPTKEKEVIFFFQPPVKPQCFAVEAKWGWLVATQRIFPCFSKGGLNQKNLLGDFHFLLDDGKKEKTPGFPTLPMFFFFFRKKQRQQPQEPQTNDVHLYIHIHGWVRLTKILRSSVPKPPGSCWVLAWEMRRWTSEAAMPVHRRWVKASYLCHRNMSRCIFFFGRREETWTDLAKMSRKFLADMWEPDMCFKQWGNLQNSSFKGLLKGTLCR